MRLRLAFRIVVVAAVALSLTFVALSYRHLRDAPPASQEVKAPAEYLPAELDQRLQSAAASALAEREGAIVVLDSQSGRVRAVVNRKLAFQSAFPPGSTIKPFTVLTALRGNVIQAGTRMRCREKYKRSEVLDRCSHPPRLGPFNPSEALAYSCNYYFAKVGEKIDEQSFAVAVSQFGFGQFTGVDEEENAGVLARGRWQPESPVGEGDFLQVTPIQLAMAYAALFNGGRLFIPTVSAAADFTPQLHAHLSINDEARSILLEGMRGAVTFGTAANAKLDSVPVYVVGKTGTSTQLQGFRSQGWFAGLAFPDRTQTGPTDVQLVVVVFLSKAHGSEAAEVARSIFEEFTGSRNASDDSTAVSVHRVTENETHKMPLEAYLVRVVSGEASVEDEPEALKALAVAARTYALKNIGRHQQEGYDFCSTTHCQRFATLEPRPVLISAIRETAGLVLQDNREQMVDAYYSASCGGMTANLRTLWSADAPPYLRGVRDEYCNSGPHYRWTDTIAAERLAAALRNDSRTDVGTTIRDLSVTRYDATGRAETIAITGDRLRTISGWEFKLIVGRALGWNVLKSSRFTVSRSGSQFVFRGGGFGHGLGLCQEGAHAMAQRGQSYQQILAHYFPGTNVSQYRPESATQRSSHFRIVHPRTVEARDVEYVLGLLEQNRSELLQRVSLAGIEVGFPDLEIVFNETTGDFVGRTGMPAWAAAATRKHTIDLQPFRVLKQRRILETTMRHELVHVLIETIGGDKTPRWFAEGMALYIAGEGRLFEAGAPRKAVSADMIEKMIAGAKSAGDLRAAYAAAYHFVREQVRIEGEARIWKRIRAREV